MALIIVPPTTATVSTAAASPTLATTPSTKALFFRTSFVDLQRPAAYFFSVQGCDRLFRFVRVRHLHEGETARPSSLPVSHYAHSFNSSVRLKQGPEFRFRGAVREIAYKQVLHDVSSSLRLATG
jgi:hypothetical protein